MAYLDAQASATRFVGIGFVVLLHLAIVYALVAGLARHAVEVVRAPVVTEIISEPKPPPAVPPPAVPQLAPPPPAFLPPPEVHIETPPAPPPKSRAITAVAPVKPPPPPVAAPAAAGIRVLPRLDPQQSREPPYPAASRRLGEQGSAVLQVLVGPDGRVSEAKLLQSSGYDRLDQAALAGIKQYYRFVPGTLDGKPQPMWFTFRFTWKLR